MRLESLRRRRGVSVREVARRVGATYATADRWFSGASDPRLTDALALADYFGVSLDELAGRAVSVARLTDRDRAILTAAEGLDVSDAVRRLLGRHDAPAARGADAPGHDVSTERYPAPAAAPRRKAN